MKEIGPICALRKIRLLSLECFRACAPRIKFENMGDIYATSKRIFVCVSKITLSSIKLKNAQFIQALKPFSINNLDEVVLEQKFEDPNFFDFKPRTASAQV